MLKFLLIIIRGSEICQRNSVPKMTFISIFKDNFAIGLCTQALFVAQKKIFTEKKTGKMKFSSYKHMLHTYLGTTFRLTFEILNSDPATNIFK